MKDITAYIGENGTDDGYTKHGAFCCIFGITSTTQTAHIDYLGNLEEDSDDDNIRDVYTNLNNMWFFREEKSKQEFSET